MPVDYYEVLGVAKDADANEIKSAFRRLARELHPDVNDSHDAEERFKDVAAAYEVLSDDQRRATYDRYGHEGLRSSGGEPNFSGFDGFQSIFDTFFGGGGFGGGGRPGGPAQGADVVVAAEIELAEVVSGVAVDVEYDVMGTCDECHGNRAEPGTPIETCDRCGGAGQLRVVSRTVLGTIERAAVCDRCDGEGKVAKTPCKRCAGRGRHGHHKTLSVDVPAGIDDGQQIRVRGGGHSGVRGGPAGDLYVQVHVADDERFVRDGSDLFTVVDLGVHEAMLGTTVEVETLDGPVDLELKPGTQHGEKHKLSGHGLPSLRGGRRSDLHAVVNLHVPHNLTDEQRALVEQFGETVTDDNLNPHKESLIAKLRRALR